MEELVRTKMHEALEVEQPDGGLRSRIMSSLPAGETPGRRFQMPSFQWAGGLLAVILAVAVVAGLLYFRGGVGRQGPASTGPVGQVAVTSQVGFKCSLPVVAYGRVFAQVQLPDGNVVNESTAPAVQGKGAYAPSGYDVQAHKWLPVAQTWISRDGKSYAYATQTTGVPGQGPTGTIHVVDVATARDRQVWAGDGSAQVMAFLSNGVYFMKSGPASPSADIWVVDPVNPGGVRRVGPNPAPPPPGPDNPMYGPQPFYQLVGPAGAFATGFNVPKDRPLQGAFFPDRILRMDLASGAVSTWFVNPTGGQVNLMGLDAQGHPVVAASKEPPPPPPAPGETVSKPTYMPYSPSRVLLLTGENQFTEIAPGTEMAFMPNTVFGDAHGVWFSVPGSVWLYDRSGGLRKVFSVPDALFPAPTPPPGLTKGTPPPGFTPPTPPPGMPTGAYLMVIGPCT